MKKLLSFCVLFLLANCSHAFKHKPEFLFVQKAKTATFDGKILQLNDVAKNTIYFSNKSERAAGHIANLDFMKEWSKQKPTKSLAKDAPNAVLSYYDRSGKANVTIVELSNLKVDGKSISYDTKIIKGKLPKNLDGLTLFVDGVACSPVFCS